MLTALKPQASEGVFGRRVYSVTTTRVACPFTRATSMHVPIELDMDAIRQGVALLRGRHNFSQFSNLPPINEVRNPNKDLTRFEVIDTPTGFCFEVRTCTRLLLCERGSVSSMSSPIV